MRKPTGHDYTVGFFDEEYDGIINLKSGSIVNSGTFDELIAKKGCFYSLFAMSQ